MNIDIQQTSAQRTLSNAEMTWLNETLGRVWCSRCGWQGLRGECRPVDSLEMRGPGCKRCGWPVIENAPSSFESATTLRNWRVWLAGVGLALVIIGVIMLVG